MLLQLNPVASSEVPATLRIEAIAMLDHQLALEGCFLNMKNGSVLLLRLTAQGWRATYWEHPF